MRERDRGASAVEYGLLLAGIAAVIVLAIYAFGGQVVHLFDSTCHTVASQVSGGSSCD